MNFMSPRHFSGGPFLHKEILKIRFYNCIDIKTNYITQAGFIITFNRYYIHIFFLFLKEIKIFLWALKSVMDSRHCASLSCG